MRIRIKELINTRQFNIIMVIIIIITIIFGACMIALKYVDEGEANLPFDISKISIISNIEGIDNEDSENKWNLKINQNNDIYIYIKKSDSYRDTETIKDITLDNFYIEDNVKKGELKLYRPDNNLQSMIFKNNIENEIDRIQYIGDLDSSIKDLKISNQGGLVVFRYAVDNIGNYISNDDDEINHEDLLKKIQITNEDINFKVSFDITISLDAGKSYKARINLQLPVDDIVNKGMQSKEITDLEDIIFKRL